MSDESNTPALSEPQVEKHDPDPILGPAAPDQAEQPAAEQSPADERLSPAFLHPEDVPDDEHDEADAARADANEAARLSREADQAKADEYAREAEERRAADPASFLTQAEQRDAGINAAPLRDEAAHAAAVQNESALLAGSGAHLDQAPVRDEDTAHVDLADDDRIPVNELAMRLGVLPNGTETCWACGHEKPKPRRPGRDLPEEFCPYCGKGSQAEPI